MSAGKEQRRPAGGDEAHHNPADSRINPDSTPTVGQAETPVEVWAIPGAATPQPVDMAQISEAVPATPTEPPPPARPRSLYRVSWRYPTWKPGHWRSRYVAQPTAALLLDQLIANSTEWRVERSAIPIRAIGWEPLDVRLRLVAQPREVAE